MLRLFTFAIADWCQQQRKYSASTRGPGWPVGNLSIARLRKLTGYIYTKKMKRCGGKPRRRKTIRVCLRLIDCAAAVKYRVSRQHGPFGQQYPRCYHAISRRLIFCSSFLNLPIKLVKSHSHRFRSDVSAITASLRANKMSCGCGKHRIWKVSIYVSWKPVRLPVFILKQWISCFLFLYLYLMRV